MSTAARLPLVEGNLGARRRTLVAVAALGLLAGVGGFLLLATSDHLVDPVGYGLLYANAAMSTVGVAIYWLVRRPGNRVALLLLVLAAAYVGIALQGAGNTWLHSVGVLFDAAVFFLTYYVVFAFPNGRLVQPLEKILLGGAAFFILSSFLPWFLFSPVVSGGAPLAACNAACPENALMIADRPGLADGAGTLEAYVAVALSAAIAVALVYRLATATRPRRRTLLPVYVPALVLTVVFGTFWLGFIDLVAIEPQTRDVLGWFLTGGRSALSYGFLLAILQTTLFAGVALKRMVDELGRDPNAAHLRALMADALDDPTLELAFRAGPDRFVDSGGEPIDPARVAPGRSAAAVGRGGETDAVIVYDDALNQDPELVRAAGRALLLALENGRLETELSTTIDELRASRARTIAAGDAERRRIERDLHDGAQQHLIALRVRLGLLSELAEETPELAGERLAGLGDELEEVLDELRRLAHGIYPSLLVDHGLEDALAAVARRSSPPTTFEADGIGRYPHEIEAGVYFCCLEALQNVGKHAGAGARARIRLWQTSGRLSFEVGDDGVGYDVGSARRDGTGLTNMSDRLGALGGTLAVDSAPGAGTTVRGSVPLAG